MSRLYSCPEGAHVHIHLSSDGETRGWLTPWCRGGSHGALLESLWLLVSSRWGWDGPGRSAWEKGVGGTGKRSGSYFGQGVLLVFTQTQAPVQKFSSFLKTPSQIHTQNCPSPPWLGLTLPGGPFLFQRQKEEGITEKKNNNKKPLLCREKWGQLDPSFPWCIISFSPDEVAEEIEIQPSPQYGFNLRKFNIPTYKPDQLKGDYSL